MTHHQILKPTEKKTAVPDVTVSAAIKTLIQLTDDNTVVISKKGVWVRRNLPQHYLMEKMELTPEQFIDLQGV